MIFFASIELSLEKLLMIREISRVSNSTQIFPHILTFKKIFSQIKKLQKSFLPLKMALKIISLEKTTQSDFSLSKHFK